MINLLKQFFSFDKMMKDRLVAAFFFLGLVVIVVMFLSTIRIALALMGHSFLGGVGLLLVALFQILFLFVTLRLTSELMVAIFRINDNLSPDGGKSDTAELDVIEAAKDAAAKAAKSASAATKSAYDKTKTKLAERGKDSEDYADYEDPTPPKRKARKPAAKKRAPAKKAATRKPVVKKAAAKKKPATRKKPATKKK